MIDSLLIIVIIALAALYAGSLWKRQRPRGQLAEASAGVKTGPVPGYSYLPGNLVRWDPASKPPGLGESWSAVCMETLHAGRRTRLVLTIQGRDLPPTDQFTIMKTLALRLLQRTGCDVAAVQLAGESSHQPGQSVLILAADGGGWTGTTSNANVTAILPGREAFRMAP